MEADTRIAQFQNMAQADPENEMAHFSLGRALAEKGRHGEAAEAFVRCTELAPTMSKAYQLAGESLLKLGEKDRAAQLLARGYTIAAERGDLMPKNAMADLLGSLGRPVPEVATKAGPGGGGGGVNLLGGGGGKSARAEPPPGGWPPGTFVDQKTGRPGTRMARPPFKGPIGAWIGENISRESFDAWIAQGTKVINELRLDLSRDEDTEVYDQHMREFLGIDEAMRARIEGGGGGLG